MQVGRNDPCPCGSGKKYKRCCLPVDQEAALAVAEHRLPEGQDEEEDPADYAPEGTPEPEAPPVKLELSRSDQRVYGGIALVALIIGLIGGVLRGPEVGASLLFGTALIGLTGQALFRGKGGHEPIQAARGAMSFGQTSGSVEAPPEAAPNRAARRKKA